MSRLEELLNVAREKGLNTEWERRKVLIIAANLGVSPERVADDVLDTMERKSCLPKSILGNGGGREK